MEARNNLIELYFNLGYKQQEILACLLLIHGQKLSFRQLKRVLVKKGLSRRTNAIDLQTVVGHIQQGLQFSASEVGYRTMWQKLVVEYGLSVPKEIVRHALRVLDPEGVDSRLR